MTARRDDLAELRFLLAAAHGHGRAGRRWATHAQCRLRDGQRDYGDTWATRPVAELLAELREEAADLGAWAALAAQRAPQLARIAAAGAGAHAALDRLEPR